MSNSRLFPSVVVSEDKDELPRFVEDVPNITVTVGRDALLPCTVEQLKGFKVCSLALGVSFFYGMLVLNAIGNLPSTCYY